MQPDINKYLPMLENMDISDEEKIELIHWLWKTMGSFVDSAFGVHPVQQAAKKNAGSDLQDSPEALNSTHNQKENRQPAPEEGSLP